MAKKVAALASLSSLVALAAFVACSSSTPAPSSNGDADASVGPGRPAGGTCDPSLGAQACAASVEPCSVAVCDPTKRRCLLTESDAATCGASQSCGAGAPCSNGDVCVSGLCYQPCNGPTDCDGGACAQYCTNPPGCAEDDACAQTCVGYCAGFGG